MPVLVVYATKHGATQEIAERVAQTMAAAGQQAQARPVTAAGDLTGYDAFVVGSAVYMGHWQKEAVEFVRHNRAVLAGRPVWLFSSGPLGTEPTDAQGQDLTAAAEPKEIGEFRQAIAPRGHQVFFGVLDPGRLGLGERALRKLPAVAPCSPRATSATGPRSKPGPAASPATPRSAPGVPTGSARTADGQHDARL